jgi:hypothetical protein
MPKAVLQLSQADYARVIWSVEAEAGVTPTDILDPTYWVHVAKSLKPGARIEVTAADKSWFVELYVRSATGNSAKVVALAQHIFSAPGKSVEGAYEVKHRGPRGWSVIRLADKIVVFEEGKTREDADQWVADNALA